MNRIKEIRNNTGITVADLSELSGISASYINNLENGHKKNPSLRTMQKLANALYVPMNELFTMY